MDNVGYMNLVEMMEDAYKLLCTLPRERANEDISIHWRDIALENIRFLNNILMQSRLSVSEKQRLQHIISLLHSWVVKFERHRASIVGGDISDDIHNRVRWDDMESAFKCRIRTGAVTNLQHKDLARFLTDAGVVTMERLKSVLREEGSIKVNVGVSCKFENVKNDEISLEVKNFNTRNATILPSTDLETWFTDNVTNPLLTMVEDFEQRDSGWSMIEIINAVICINRYEPLRGGLSTFTSLPEDIQRKKAVVNVQNDDDRCLLWSVAAALHPIGVNATRPHSYQRYISELNCTGIKFPATLHSVEKFEKLNNLSINVYGIESETFQSKKKSNSSVITPLYLSKNVTENNVIHLLMIESKSELDDNLDNFKPRFHFAWIKNLSRLVSMQLSDHKCAQFLCDRCLCHFNVQNAYENHRQDCLRLNKVRMEFPKKNTLEFSNFKNQGTVPFVVYADLECMMKPGVKESQKHVPHSAAYYWRLNSMLAPLRGKYLKRPI